MTVVFKLFSVLSTGDKQLVGVYDTQQQAMDAIDDVGGPVCIERQTDTLSTIVYEMELLPSEMRD